MYHYIIIDDEELTRKGILSKLASVSDQVSCIGEAKNGEEGLELTEKLRPDIVITDMKMPVMGGDLLLPLLTEKYPDMPIIVISGYRDFEYSRQAIRANAIDYLLKPFSDEDIISAIMQAAAKIETAFQAENKLRETVEDNETIHYSYDKEQLRNLISGYSDASVNLRSRRLQFANQNRSLVLMLLHSSMRLTEDAISAFLCDNNYDETGLYLPHMYTDTLGFLLLFLPPNAHLDIRTFSTQIVRSLSSHFRAQNQKVIYGVSAPCVSPQRLHGALLESVHALNQRRIGDTNNIYFFEEKKPSHRRIVWERTEELLFNMEAGHTRDVKQLTEALFQYYRSLTEVSLSEIKHSCSQLTSQVKLMLSQYIRQVNSASLESSTQNILDTLFSLEEMESYYQQFFKTIAMSLENDNIYSDSDVVKNVRTYIDHNYQKDISVEFVASLFHMNRSYLSHIFKKKTNCSFVDYLNRVRIDHAKTILKETDKKMYQVAKGVGYDNVRHFYHIFKKLEKMTPEQYRKS